MKAGKIWGETELVHANNILNFTESVLNQDSNAQSIFINTNGMVSSVRAVNCLSAYGRMTRQT